VLETHAVNGEALGEPQRSDERRSSPRMGEEAQDREVYPPQVASPAVAEEVHPSNHPLGRC